MIVIGVNMGVFLRMPHITSISEVTYQRHCRHTRNISGRQMKKRYCVSRVLTVMAE
jgi:hypothetical protein